MKKKLSILMLVLLIVVLAACNNDTENVEESEELKTLTVDFQVPEKADVGEVVELKAVVNYGNEKVNDADEVEFEYWLKGNEDDTTKVKSTNNGDGTYTVEVTFDTDGIYEIYAHTTARDLHTMPKKSISVGEVPSLN